MLANHSYRYVPRLSKREMLAAISGPISRASQPCRNTLEYTDSRGARVIMFHKTAILTFPQKGGFKIDTGGWNTVTTRDRLNKFLPEPWRVHTKKGYLHLRNYDEATPKVLFTRTIQVKPDGTVCSDTRSEKAEALRAKVGRYIKLYRERGLPTAEESGGDPWVAGVVDRGVMLDWIRTGYRHRRLFTLALEFAGATPLGQYIRLNAVDGDGGKLRAYDLRQIQRYVRACLGLAR